MFGAILLLITDVFSADCTGIEECGDNKTCCTLYCQDLPSWFLRDKCLCDHVKESCEVYCKNPYYNRVNCTNYCGSNETRLCQHLENETACINFCGSDLECWCQYGRPFDTNACSPYCGGLGKGLECDCKYKGGGTNACFLYCEQKKDKDDYLQCQCDYLMNSTACELICNKSVLPGEAVKRWECYCTTLQLDADNKTRYSTELCSEIQNNFKANHTYTEKMKTDSNNLCECYYGEINGSCISYCESVFAGNSTKIDECKCQYYKDYPSCIRVCEADKSLNASAMNLCKCQYNESEACQTYCRTAFVDDLNVSRCFCDLAQTREACYDYCRNTYSGTYGPAEKDLAMVMCDEYCSTWEDPESCHCYVLNKGRFCESSCVAVAANKTNNEELDIAMCRRYCDSKVYAEDVGTCLCNYTLAPYLCRDHCKPNQFNKDWCNRFCDSLHNRTKNGTEKDKLLCECNFDLKPETDKHVDTDTNPSCERYCDLFGVGTSAYYKCRCDLNLTEISSSGEIEETSPCIKLCFAYINESEYVLGNRCFCREKMKGVRPGEKPIFTAGKDGEDACVLYCNLLFPYSNNTSSDNDTTTNSTTNIKYENETRALRNKCKCEYLRGDIYCRNYSRDLHEDLDRIIYQCVEMRNMVLCHDLCQQINSTGNRTETAKCWCEMYGDKAWCPYYCNTLPTSHIDMLRCKCEHMHDNPSCIQYCSTFRADSPERDECECTLISADPDAVGASAETAEDHIMACKKYCWARPTYVERVQCSCDYEIDPARCLEIGSLVAGGPGVEELKKRAELKDRCIEAWEGEKHEVDCRAYCNAFVPPDTGNSGNLTDPPLENITEIWRDNIEWKDDLPEKKGQPFKWDANECSCDYVKDKDSCNSYCSQCTNETKLLEAGVRKIYIGRDECDCVKLNKSCDKYCNVILPNYTMRLNMTDEEIQAKDIEYDKCKCESIPRLILADEAKKLLDPTHVPEELPYYRCKKYCNATYGFDGFGMTSSGVNLPYYACYVAYNKKEVSEQYCQQFSTPSLVEFCLCLFDPNSEHCKQYCTEIENEIHEKTLLGAGTGASTGSGADMGMGGDVGMGEEMVITNTTERAKNRRGTRGITLQQTLPMVRMCKCFSENDLQACNVFCDDATYVDYLCKESCEFWNPDPNVKAEANAWPLKYQECLCTAGEDEGCRFYCEEKNGYFEANVNRRNQTAYYECRCDYQLDLYSCFKDCHRLTTGAGLEECLAAKVYLGPGTTSGKGRYADDLDTDDRWDGSPAPPYPGSEPLLPNDPEPPPAKSSKTTLIVITVVVSVLGTVGWVGAVVVGIFYCRHKSKQRLEGSSDGSSNSDSSSSSASTHTRPAFETSKPLYTSEDYSNNADDV